MQLMENKATKFISYGEKQNRNVLNYTLCLSNLNGNNKAIVMRKLSHKIPKKLFPIFYHWKCCCYKKFYL